jgi:hypothetical protein
MTYIRINYTNVKDIASSAYLDPETGQAYDVATHLAVALTRDKLTGLYSEKGREPAPRIPRSENGTVEPSPVVVYPYYKQVLEHNPLRLLWLAIPVALYGIVGIFITLAMRR